ncbi:class I SAM-dependent methyltransferase [Lysobacter solisilvae (ex Woo and Kim 2020)]|uniref:Methyltransferase domain-containing protein n=1 Tax=Agrilutibacter terrestris TaxID=2865112 RepID=A0A7H0FZ62_9GAMM|nr:methyltransferase domain-containing protein [Lysobacter terrestris]QNP41328.1 methyltransferase domain-containing protein [Lysobacter terrestris]
MTDAHVDVYAHANPVFVRTVRAHGGRPEVLDVGCWNGTLGRALIRDANATVDGIERDAEQAQHARENGYRRVDVGDLDRGVPDADGRTYDFLLFGDVLEHTMHPDQVLAALVPRLKPGGRALLSLPNIAFAVNRLTHLLGRWDYRDYGILDRTHLRFFTKRTMVQLVEGAGLRVVRIDGYVGLHKHPWFVREPLRWLGRAWPSLFAIQIVLEAVPASGPRTPRD